MKTIFRKLAGLFPTPKSKRDRFAAEREICWRAFQDATRRRDTGGMNAASAELQRVTHAQLRAEVGL